MGGVIINCDGACEPSNPGGWACWGWAATQDNQQIASGYGCLGHGEGMTNNAAEYQAFIEAAKYAKRQEWPDVRFLMDSKLVVEQVNGRWAVRALHLAETVAQAKQLLQGMAATLAWVPREENETADQLSRRGYEVARKRNSLPFSEVVLPIPAQASLFATPPTAELTLALPASTPDLDAFRGSVVTMRLLGEEYQTIKARVEKGEEYLRANVKLPVVREWLGHVWALEYGDERAAAIGQRVAKLQPALAPAITLLMELRAKCVDLDRRVGVEADIQHDLEQRLTGGQPGRYVCTQCFAVVGEHGQCRCWEEATA